MPVTPELDISAHVSLCEAILDAALMANPSSFARGFWEFNKGDLPLGELPWETSVAVLKKLKTMYSGVGWTVYLEEYSGKYSLKLSDSSVPALSGKNTPVGYSLLGYP